MAECVAEVHVSRFYEQPAFSSTKWLDMTNLKIQKREKPSPSWCAGIAGAYMGQGSEECCPACAALLEYARQRRDRCPHGEIDSHE